MCCLFILSPKSNRYWLMKNDNEWINDGDEDDDDVDDCDNNDWCWIDDNGWIVI